MINLRKWLGVVWLGLAVVVRAADDTPQTGPKTPEDLRRDAAIAAFTQKQETANWPEKFQRIGTEMGVPPDILAAVSFAETRWDHLTWPPGETVSPENGMPRPYGIMSLMDNDYFGHSLQEAARLIGKTADELKADPELNIRGAAALLKKLYGDNPLPDGTSTNDIESWQNAIMKYCGIPEEYLSYDHVYSCYVYMTQGYDQYGMHWRPHAANLTPMKERRDKLWAERKADAEAKQALTPEQLATAPSKPAPDLLQPPPVVPPPAVAVTTMVPPMQVNAGFSWIIWLMVGAAVLMVVWLLWKIRKGKKS